MDLDQRDGKLRVHYGDRLVTLMREVRQLSALGFAVPAKIQQTASTANKFYRHGMILKQVELHCVILLVPTCSAVHTVVSNLCFINVCE